MHSYYYIADTPSSPKVRSYRCHNCNSSHCLTIQRHMIDEIQSILLWSCNNYGFRWQNRWSSYSQSIWSSQYQHHDDDQKKQQQGEEQLQTMSEVI